MKNTIRLIIFACLSLTAFASSPTVPTEERAVIVEAASELSLHARGLSDGYRDAATAVANAPTNDRAAIVRMLRSAAIVNRMHAVLLPEAADYFIGRAEAYDAVAAHTEGQTEPKTES